MIQPWCDTGFCLAVPAAPQRRQPTVTPPAGWTARAAGGTGEGWFATTQPNTLGHVTAAGGLEQVTLPGDAFYPVDGIAAVSATDIYACNSNAQAWHYDGTQWSELSGWFPGLDCSALWAGATDDVWRIANGQLSHLTGGTWSNITGSDTVYTMSGSGTSDVWFGGARGYVAHWDGTQYTVLIDASDDGDVPDIHDVAVLGPNDVAIGANRIVNDTVMTSAQLGYPATPEVTWGTSSDFWIGSKPTSGNTGRTLWHYAGGTWTQASRPEGTLQIVGTGPSDVWFFFEHAISHWDGSTLDDCSSWGTPASTGGKLRGTATDYSDMWMLRSTASKLAHSVAGGDFVDDTYIYGTRGFDARPGAGVFAVSGYDDVDHNGQHPVARHFDGSTWTDIACPWTQGADQLLLSAKAFAGNDAWFAGAAGTVFHWDGTACTLVTHPLASTNITVIEGAAPDDVWFFGASATLHWDGTALTRYTDTIAATDAFAAGTSVFVNGGNEVKQWDGTAWTSKGTTPGNGSIWASSASDIWVLTASALVHYDGTTWNAVPGSSILGVGPRIGSGLWGGGVTAGDFMIASGGALLHHP